MCGKLVEFQSVLKAPRRKRYGEKAEGAAEGWDYCIAPISSILVLRLYGIFILKMGEQTSVGEDPTQEPKRNNNREKC